MVRIIKLDNMNQNAIETRNANNLKKLTIMNEYSTIDSQQ